MKFSLCLFAVLLFPGLLSAQDPAVPPPPPTGEPAAEPTKQDKLDALIQQVQTQIEFEEDLRGAYLAGGQFMKNQEMPGEVLQLSGKLMDPAQGKAVEKLVQDALEADPYWRKGEGPLTISSATMRISPGDPQLANELYGLGLNAYWEGDYEKAGKAFSKAAAEVPNDDVIRYWSAVNALAQGQEDKAKARLTPLVQIYPQGSRTPIIARELERVQGPLRQRLNTLENELLLSL